MVLITSHQKNDFFISNGISGDSLFKSIHKLDYKNINNEKV